MLRYYMCKALKFVNGPVSQQYLINLPEDREYY